MDIPKLYFVSNSKLYGFGLNCLWSPININCLVFFVNNDNIWDSKTSAASSIITISKLFCSKIVEYLAAPVVVIATILYSLILSASSINDTSFFFVNKVLNLLK